MQKEIEFAVKETQAMQLSTEQSIKFIMRMTGCDYKTAKSAITKEYDFSY